MKSACDEDLRRDEPRWDRNCSRDRSGRDGDGESRADFHDDGLKVRLEVCWEACDSVSERPALMNGCR